jgi:DinB superfamily
MMEESLEALKYPVGSCPYPQSGITAEDRRSWIAEVAALPSKLRSAVASLTPEQLDSPYRPGGWTVRQVVHHIPDSHLNAFVRFKLALTEDVPTIKPYDEAGWATLADYAMPVDVSLLLLETLHERWVRLLESMTAADFARKFRHPESGVLSLEQYLATYAWHSRHHVAHITSLRKRMRW